MRFLVKYNEILEFGNWTYFCEVKGINPHALAEGTLDGEKEVTLTWDEMGDFELWELIEG